MGIQLFDSTRQELNKIPLLKKPTKQKNPNSSMALVLPPQISVCRCSRIEKVCLQTGEIRTHIPLGRPHSRAAQN